MNIEHLELGKAGEQKAQAYLEKLGYTLVECNYRVPFGEVDLIMRDQETLVFVEVRTKTDLDHGHPLETITPAKKQKLVKAAMAYLKKHGQYDVLCRFDVMAMIPQTRSDWDIEHIPNAFEVQRFT